MLTKVWVKKDILMAKVKRGLCRFVQDEQGDFGIAQIGGIVATLVILGVIVTVVSGNMEVWVEDVWGWLKTWIENILT